jgi:hypothetical protein
MNKLLYVLVFLGVFVVLYSVGRAWKLKPETRYDHTLHNGEIAVLKSPGNSAVWLAVDKKDCYAVSAAMSAQDPAHLKTLEDNRTAFAVPAGTFVRMMGAADSRDRVEVTDGPFAGRTGWVEFQYLRPRQPGEFQ